MRAARVRHTKPPRHSRVSAPGRCARQESEASRQPTRLLGRRVQITTVLELKSANTTSEAQGAVFMRATTLARHKIPFLDRSVS